MRTLAALVALFAGCKSQDGNVKLDTVEGMAENAKGGAIIVVDDRQIIYVEKLDSWPGDAHRKKVRATGRLVVKQYLPEAQDDPITQGAKGKQTVLENPKWEVVK